MRPTYHVAPATHNTSAPPPLSAVAFAVNSQAYFSYQQIRYPAGTEEEERECVGVVGDGRTHVCLSLGGSDEMRARDGLPRRGPHPETEGLTPRQVRGLTNRRG